MPTINARQLGWRVLTAASTGAHHITTGLPYQDAVGVRPATSRETDVQSVAVAVADGHGHARHFRSERGSQLAVEIATELGGRLAADVGGFADAKAVDKALRTRMGPELVRAWRRAVEQDLKDAPVSADELSAAGLTAQASIDDLVYGYGATLIVAVTAGGWLLCLQIGDGDLFVVTDTGTVLRPLPADPRLDGSRTTSLCQPDAVESLRFAVVDVAEKSIGAVMLATDGYGNAQVRNDWEVAFGSDLAALIVEHGPSWVGEQLPRWVANCASSQGSGDDVTVALMFVSGTTWRQPAPSARKVTSADATVISSTPDATPSLPPAGRAAAPVADAPTVRASPPTANASASPSAANMSAALDGAPTVPASPPALPAPVRAAASAGRPARSPAPSTPAPTGKRHRVLVITLSLLVAIAVVGLAALILYATK